MRNGYARWRCVLALMVMLVGPLAAFADPEDVRNCRRNCPRSEYARLHYGAPSVYQARAWIHPSCLDQYPPGPAGDVPNVVHIERYKCRAIPAAPTAPYADPASYYGRPILPPTP